MKVRILIEQGQSYQDNYLASGEVVDLPNERAKELLDRGDAEPVAEKRAAKAEKRPARRSAEKR